MARIGIRATLGTAAAAAAATASAVGAATAPPAGALATCATRSAAAFPDAFTSRHNLVLGPLVLIGAGGIPAYSASFGGQKLPLLVSAGHRVTMALPVQARKGAGLAYGPLPQGEVGVRDAHRIVTFVACPHGSDSGSTASGRPVTFWSGGLLARSPRCVPLLVWIDAARAPLRVVVHLGVGRCTAAG
ncbi:MAG TPA: hypothetical protein VF094_08040 [Gaiellaceae bacterium]